MKSKLYMLLGLMAFITFFTSCKKNEVESTTLTLSETSLTFGRAAESKTVKVQTNQDQWTFMQSDQWFSVEQDGKNLTITVPENAKGVSRKGSVMVLSGDMAVRIEVVQSAADVVVTSIPETMFFGPGADKLRVEVITNTDDYKVVKFPDWMTVKPYLGSKTFLLEIKANSALLEREGKIELQVGVKKAELTVSQLGQLLFPIFGDEYDMDKIVELEQKRGSKLKSLPSLFDDYFTFTTMSKIVPQMKYKPNGRNTTEEIMMGMPLKVYEGDECKNYIKAKGFEIDKKLTSEDIPVYKNTELGVTFYVEKRGDVAVFTFNYIIKQKQKYPTFQKFPYYSDVKMLNKADEAAVEAYEAKHGGVRSEEEIWDKKGQIFFDVAKGEESLFGRLYYFEESDAEDAEEGAMQLMETIGYYKDYNKAVWIYDRKPLITEEFDALLEKEGFAFLQKDDDAYYYTKAVDYDQENDLYLGIVAKQYKEINDGKITLQLHYFMMPKEDAEHKKVALNRYLAQKKSGKKVYAPRIKKARR